MADDTETKTNILTLETLRQGPPTVSLEIAAQYLGVSRPFVYRMAKRGDLPVIRLGTTRMRVPSAKLLRLLEGEGGDAG